MIKFLKRFLDTNEREIAAAEKVLKVVNELESQIQAMNYEAMQARIREMRAQLQSLNEQVPEGARDSLQRIDRTKGMPDYEVTLHEKLMEFMPEVYAMVREVLNREFGRRHYDVQIVAAIILAQGQKLTELKTGEGKTQVFQLPLILYALAGRGAHLITVNDYLAKRDAEYAGFVANKLGLSVGVINSGQMSYRFADFDEIKERKGEEQLKLAQAQWANSNLADLRGHNMIQVTKHDAYKCDITVGINNEFGFDYLRDNMANSLAEIVQRELFFCIIDECDSILIDEARTPLIISALPEASDLDKYKKFARAASKLEEEKDFEIDHKTRTVTLTEDGIKKSEDLLGLDNIWADASAAHHMENALKAKALFIRDDEYIVQDGEVLIVDTFTGRVMPGRRFSEGIHQAIEAKEGVEIQQESKTMATITFQNFFRLYKYLVGGSGTVMTEAEEFYKIYDLESVAIPTNRPIAREDAADVIYRTQEVKYVALAKEVRERHETGQPILIGTTSVEKSELVSQLLDEEGVPHEVLNAKYHERESQIVATAGKVGAVMVATNMAGRGTDIPLSDEAKALGGLAVIGTERHEARRIDNQLRGRSGRQGEPGYTRFYVSLDDTIMRVIGGEVMERMVGGLMQDDIPIELGLISRQIESAQRRVEGMNFDTRKSLVDYDDVMNRQREVYYTRRRALLAMSDKALPPEFGEESDVDKARRLESLQKLQTYIREAIADEIDFIIDSQYQNQRELKEPSEIDAIVNNILDLANDQRIANAFDFKEAELQKRLQEEIASSKKEEFREFAQSKLKNLVEAKLEEMNEDLPRVVKAITLDGMNRLWMEHLETMNDLRSGITLQAYAQRDPLVAYKTQGFEQFEELMQKVDANLSRRILKISRISEQQVQQLQQAQQLQTNADQIADVLTGDREIMAGNQRIDAQVRAGEASAANLRRQAQAASGRQQTIVNEDKVGRNDICPCGSGKKYKKCGLQNTAEHRQNMAAK